MTLLLSLISVCELKVGLYHRITSTSFSKRPFIRSFCVIGTELTRFSQIRFRDDIQGGPAKVRPT